MLMYIFQSRWWTIIYKQKTWYECNQGSNYLGQLDSFNLQLDNYFSFFKRIKQICTCMLYIYSMKSVKMFITTVTPLFWYKLLLIEKFSLKCHWIIIQILIKFVQKYPKASAQAITVPFTNFCHFTHKANLTSVRGEANAHSADWLMSVWTSPVTCMKSTRSVRAAVPNNFIKYFNATELFMVWHNGLSEKKCQVLKLRILQAYYIK